MKFNDLLNEYLSICNCSSKELSLKSGVSQSVISRYRSGERTPLANSKQLKKISSAIKDIMIEKNLKDYEKVNIYENLLNKIKQKDNFNYENFSINFNNLINALKININEMSKYIIFDPSHISRIRYGKAKPSDPISFCKKITNFIIIKYNTPEYKNILYNLLKIKSNELNNKDMFKAIYNYLTNNNLENNSSISNFLDKLDKFDLNDYIAAISFDKIKVPYIPFYKAREKKYFGLEEMKQGELDFFKATVLSKNNSDIFMCSDMPMEDMAKDIEFGKKWMFAIAMCLKKGLHLDIIHNLDRPFNEMMLGLESWMPIYMTGQISPYYLKEVKNCVYQHLNYVSGDYALTGECIKGYHNKGKYHLITNNKEIKYYNKKANLLIKKAQPLMEIYRENEKLLFNEFLQKDKELKSNRKRILNSLPIFTISDKLLEKILQRNKISKKDINLIKEYKNKEKLNIENKLKDSQIIDLIYYYTNKEEFNKENIYLALESIFFNKKIKYNYDEYKEHLKETEKYINKNYIIIKNDYKTFKNIVIDVVKDNYVIISKNNDPIIHFVIKHPKLVFAIENFNPLIKENIGTFN